MVLIIWLLETVLYSFRFQWMKKFACVGFSVTCVCFILYVNNTELKIWKYFILMIQNSCMLLYIFGLNFTKNLKIVIAHQQLHSPGKEALLFMLTLKILIQDSTTRSFISSNQLVF